MAQQTAAPAALAPDTAQTLPAIGAQFGGGYFAGQVSIAGVLYGLVMAGAAGELSGRWNSLPDSVMDEPSRADGMANTEAMASAGSKLAQRAMALDINGFTDWYIPARDELELLYRHFKPSAEKSYRGEGANPSSVPPGEKYTATSPVQTTFLALIEDEADALIPAWYWSSTQYAGYPYNAWGQTFDNGDQCGSRKSHSGRARAVRRFVI